MGPWPLASVLVVAGIFLLAGVVLAFSPFLIWIHARFSGAPMGIVQISRMILRKMNPMTIIRCKVALNKAGIDASPRSIERFYTDGGDPQQLALALIAAQERGATLSFDDAAGIELARHRAPDWFGQR